MKNFTKMFLAAFIITGFAFSVNAQGVSINSTGEEPNSKAILDVSSTTQGFLPPRMTYAQRIAITDPPAGLIVWCSNCGPSGELQIFNGTIWTSLIAGTASGLPGAPTIGTVTAGFAQAYVPYTAPASNGGSTINSYTATSSPGGITGTLEQSGSGTITVTGLTDGTAYTFTVTATNATGTGPASAVSNAVTAGVLLIGDSFGGGKIAYILQPGDPGYKSGETHGLIAAPNDLSATDWGCFETQISGADGTALGTGNQNTIDIVAGCSTAGKAARICYDLELNGFSDWYLPSKDELNKLYLNQAAIGGFVPASYWSSSEVYLWEAWNQYFSDGVQINSDKFYTHFVRAIRAF